MSFYGFKKIKFSIKIHRCQPTVLPKVTSFAVKTDQKFIFLVRDPHITDQQHIMVSYLSFYGY
jgi:hypothetical protein